MLMEVPPEMITHMGSHTNSMAMTRRTNAAQGIHTEDIDILLGGTVSHVPDTIEEPIVDMRTVLQLGLTPVGEETRRSAGGTSVGTQDTDISETPSDARSMSMWNIKEAYSKSKEKVLSALSGKLASEERETAAVRELAEFKEEQKRRDKETKEREKEEEKKRATELMAFQADLFQQMRELRESFEIRMGQPAVAERSTEPDNDQSEAQPDETMHTQTPHPPAAEATPSSNMTHSVSFKIDDGTGAEKPPKGSSAPVEK